MLAHHLTNIVLWKVLDIVGDFLILFIVILITEWYAVKKQYNLFERAWLLTVAVLMVLIIFLWGTFGRLLIWL